MTAGLGRRSMATASSGSGGSDTGFSCPVVVGRSSPWCAVVAREGSAVIVPSSTIVPNPAGRPGETRPAAGATAPFEGLDAAPRHGPAVSDTTCNAPAEPVIVTEIPPR